MICELVFMMMLLVFLYPTQLHFYCLSFCGGCAREWFSEKCEFATSFESW